MKRKFHDRSREVIQSLVLFGEGGFVPHILHHIIDTWRHILLSNACAWFFHRVLPLTDSPAGTDRIASTVKVNRRAGAWSKRTVMEFEISLTKYAWFLLL